MSNDSQSPLPSAPEEQPVQPSPPERNFFIVGHSPHRFVDDQNRFCTFIIPDNHTAGSPQLTRDNLPGLPEMMTYRLNSHISDKYGADGCSMIVFEENFGRLAHDCCERAFAQEEFLFSLRKMFNQAPGVADSESDHTSDYPKPYSVWHPILSFLWRVILTAVLTFITVAPILYLCKLFMSQN